MHEWMCSYGATGSGKLVDAAGLQLLENMGFQRALAAEALKQVRKEKKRKEKKRKEKTTPFGVNLMRSQVLYRAAQTQTGDITRIFLLQSY